VRACRAHSQVRVRTPRAPGVPRGCDRAVGAEQSASRPSAACLCHGAQTRREVGPRAGAAPAGPAPPYNGVELVE